MHKTIFISSIFILNCSQIFCNDTDSIEDQNLQRYRNLPPPSSPYTLSEKKSFSPFTGTVERTKVRLRLQPNYDSEIIEEINPGSLFIVDGEDSDFYQIVPAKKYKAYIFRTFVLDGEVEGSRVNIRLSPDIDAPIIAKYESGQKVNGKISSENSKWLEIDMPPEVRFYMSKEFVEKVGDAKITQTLKENLDLAEKEFEKPFSEISIEPIVDSYEELIKNYSEFPAEVAKAKKQLTNLLNEYKDKKIAYLESDKQAYGKYSNLNQTVEEQKNRIKILKEQLDRSRALDSRNNESNKLPHSTLPFNMSYWIPQEEAIYNAWTKESSMDDMDQFYFEQANESLALRGIVQVYNRPVKNKPGDYILVNPLSNLPVAYLYSTQVNLQEYVGQEVNVDVSPRPNNGFAYPAYFVLSIK